MSHRSAYGIIAAMGAFKKQNGYTMTETLIVLGVTAAVFGVTVTMVSGQMARYKFKDGVNTANQIIRDTLNDVQTGYFEPVESSQAPGSCSSSGAGTSNCVFAGKRIDIATNGTITRTSLWTDGTTMPTTTTAMNDAANVITSKLPQAVEYGNNLTFYVLYKNYTGNSVTSGGAQAYEVRYRGTGNTLVIRPDGSEDTASVCIKDGKRSARIIVGIDGSMTAKTDFEAICT